MVIVSTEHVAECEAASSAGFTAMRLGVEYDAVPYNDDDLDWHWRNGWWLAADGMND